MAVTSEISRVNEMYVHTAVGGGGVTCGTKWD